MAALPAQGALWPGAVAVSGGSDSLALMHLISHWAKRSRLAPPTVLTVDHRLHKDSSANARKVLRMAKEVGLKAHVLVWTGKKPTSDIEAAARDARYRLLGTWLKRNGLAALYVGHTSDDQAETFLLRLGRGSGLDGLAAMSPLAFFPLQDHRELALVRPLLAESREILRGHLKAKGQTWLEDPMNRDPRHARVRIRDAWAGLEAIGLKKSRIADAAAHLSRAREALDMVTDAVLRRAARPAPSGVLIDPSALAAAPREVGLRALARVLIRVSGEPYRPRFDRLERLFDRIAASEVGNGCTLHGCKIASARSGDDAAAMLLISRETKGRSA